MTQQKNGRWMTAMALGAGIVLGAGTVAWMPHASTVPMTTGNHEPRYDQQFAQLEQAVTALTQSLERSPAPDVRPEPTCAPAQSRDTMTEQALAKIVREELRHALAQWSPESQQARAEEIANAQILNSPENQVAYQGASAVVRTAIAAKRWTDEDRQALNDALSQLTKEQYQELMELLLPAINRGEIKVETAGPFL
ncbi:MAG: hypothetical protein HOP18_26795 [Deltaproteobacteria bacterium]|nr:hypothetical protein [Deltaproteobacteria bacterium]